jgi:DNA recombination protein RmuC
VFSRLYNILNNVYIQYLKRHNIGIINCLHMNLQFLIMVIVAFLIGVVIAWYFAKVKANSTTIELQTKLNIADESKKQHEQQLQRKEGEIEIKQQALIEALKEKSSVEATLKEFQQREEKLRMQLEDLSSQLTTVKEKNSSLESTYNATIQRLDEQQKFVEDAQRNLKDAFGALSADALKNNNTSFVELARAKLEEKVTEAKAELEKKEQAIGELVKPLNESLKSMDAKIQDLEGKRIKAYSDIWNYLDLMKSTTEGLKKETTNLVGALKTSHSRGRYGELALRRLVEHAGMFEHCDFEEQVSVEDESGRLRPDMIIKLPGNKTLVVDSKAPLSAYMKMFETDDVEQQKMLLGQHVIAVKDHLKKLSAKAYWSQFNEAPDFVIMYMHIESSYGVALQAYPEMIEEAMKNRVIIATPTVLLSILLGVGYSWNQLKTMENIEAIRDAAVELHDRSAVLIDHIANLGKALNSSISHYNKAIGSLEGSFLPQARKINLLSQAYTKKQIPEIVPIETSIRTVTAVSQLTEDNSITTLQVEE